MDGQPGHRNKNRMETPIAKTIMTAMRELTTKDERTFTKMPLSEASRRFPSFQTCNDSVLEEMVVEAAEFKRKFEDESSRPTWLSFVGSSGTGKTFLAESVYGYARMCDNLIYHRSLLSGVTKRFWPKLVTKLRDQEFWQIDDLADANFVFLDEIAVEHDPSGFAKDKLCELLSRRVGKWTLLTSN